MNPKGGRPRPNTRALRPSVRPAARCAELCWSEAGDRLARRDCGCRSARDLRRSGCEPGSAAAQLALDGQLGPMLLCASRDGCARRWAETQASRPRRRGCGPDGFGFRYARTLCPCPVCARGGDEPSVHGRGGVWPQGSRQAPGERPGAKGGMWRLRPLPRHALTSAPIVLGWTRGFLRSAGEDTRSCRPSRTPPKCACPRSRGRPRSARTGRARAAKKKRTLSKSPPSDLPPRRPPRSDLPFRRSAGIARLR